MARPSNEELSALKEELESLINSGNELVSKLESHDSEFSNLINTISAESTAATKNSEGIEDLKQAAEEAVSEIHDLKNTATTDFHAVQQLICKVPIDNKLYKIPRSSHRMVMALDILKAVIPELKKIKRSP